ncbi:type IV pilin protein [Conchiformibius steedae]|uniref:Prepilin-type N-terminal cleavage/methylation domain-containing protein n=1 Tax=Conchiformibius steedae TaxID=153493 RepID=A0A3P2A9W0_9NEIS|nr:prepilin-type N-terminal cleavage/methylation domain-containing protein [Conchiformibius steedae]RRD91758.1 prepilin-type N-terminal cleavage/methylation domain-containing protein [Conchiformibius steedae]
MTHSDKKRLQSGFTLIELMVTIAIIAVLALMAYPSYQRFVQMGRMEKAREIMVKNTHMMEQLYARHSSFTCPASGGSLPGCKGRGGQVPQAEGDKTHAAAGNVHTGFYEIGIQTPSPNRGNDSYWVYAKPNNNAKRGAFSDNELNNQEIYLLYFSGTGTFSKCTQAGLDAAMKPLNAANANAEPACSPW